MIIECEFMHASNLLHERVLFLTDLQLLVDSNNLLYCVAWDESKNQPTASIGKLHRAMHDSEFRIHLDKGGGHFMTLARCVGTDWTVWFIRVDWRPRNKIYFKLCVLQRYIRHRRMRRRLIGDKIFSRAAFAYTLLTNRLCGKGDVVMMVVRLFLICDRQQTPIYKLYV